MKKKFIMATRPLKRKSPHPTFENRVEVKDNLTHIEVKWMHVSGDEKLFLFGVTLPRERPFHANLTSLRKTTMMSAARDAVHGETDGTIIAFAWAVANDHVLPTTRVVNVEKFRMQLLKENE